MTKEVVGVALCVRSGRGTILFIEELKAKPAFDKHIGLLSVPLETIEDEENVGDATRRLILEEIGSSLLDTLKGFQLLEVPLCGTYASGISFRLYVAWVDVEDEFRACPTDSDIAHNGWYTESQIQELQAQGRLRVEVPLVLALCHDRMQTTT